MSLKSRTIKDLTRRLYFGGGEHVEWPIPNELMGIELEAEQVYCSLSNVLNMAGWTMDRDGSLRNDGREFVLTQPLAGSSLTRAIHTLFEMQRSENRSPLQYVVNPRAGTHIHINWIEDTVGSAAALIALMYIIEPLVYSWADEDRAWCSYCNPLSDIPAHTINKLLRMDVDEEDEWVLRNIEDEDLGRYHGLNIVALAKYGSFEFRYFPSTTSHADMVKWVKFVQLAKLCAIKYQDDITVLVERLLQGNVAEFLSEHFGVDGIDAELLTAVNDANSIVIEKAGELGAIMEMRPINTELFSRNLAPAARRYIERVSGRSISGVVIDDEEEPTAPQEARYYTRGRAQGPTLPADDSWSQTYEDSPAALATTLAARLRGYQNACDADMSHTTYDLPTSPRIPRAQEALLHGVIPDLHITANSDEGEF